MSNQNQSKAYESHPLSFGVCGESRQQLEAMHATFSFIAYVHTSNNTMVAWPILM